jgi:hypothetical protein
MCRFKVWYYSHFTSGTPFLAFRFINTIFPNPISGNLSPLPLSLPKIFPSHSLQTTSAPFPLTSFSHLTILREVWSFFFASPPPFHTSTTTLFPYVRRFRHRSVPPSSCTKTNISNCGARRTASYPSWNFGSDSTRFQKSMSTAKIRTFWRTRGSSRRAASRSKVVGAEP